MLGALCWRSGCYPILVLGDKSAWHASWIKRLFSSRIGFLIERGKLKLNRIEELQRFAAAGQEYHLFVFPEGTRSDGLRVLPFQPGLHCIAMEARLPIVPVFIQHMHRVSTKAGRFHPVGGLRKVEVHFGEPIPPEHYAAMPREEFLEFVRGTIANAANPGEPAPTAGGT
jgi:1-acyl-sn-glycerol-3-phosphate acyltransferase